MKVNEISVATISTMPRRIVLITFTFTLLFHTSVAFLFFVPSVFRNVPDMQSAEERRRLKELDEARKAGLAPAALDEDGKEINPHIPEYMTSAPWYLNKGE